MQAVPARLEPETRSPAELAGLDDEALLDAVQRQTFRYFWDGAHPVSGLAFDRHGAVDSPDTAPCVSGGTGFGVMAILVAVERGWVARDEALGRLQRIVDLFLRAPCYHGAFPHFLDGRSGATIPFGYKDDAADLVETSFLIMGLLCARQYFAGGVPAEQRLRAGIDTLWNGVEWDWFTQGGRPLLYWHWSPNNGWAMDHEIHGWNECLITYLLAAASPRHAVDPKVYHRGYAGGRDFLNGHRYDSIPLPLGQPGGGPLFFAHYSFLGLDPRGLSDRYADYWQQNLAHVAINRAHCVRNAHGYAGYGEHCWGLTASDDWAGYNAHAPDHDNGTISPTAALASLPYAPDAVMPTLRHFLRAHGDRLWGRYGFVDAFSEQHRWTAETFLAIDQGPIVGMLENHRSGLLWRLFMSVPEVQAGLARLDFKRVGRVDA